MDLMWKLFFLLLTTVAHFVMSSDKIVMCYYGTWATYRPGLGKFDVEHIDTNLCTHLVYTFVGINSQGTVISLDPYLDLSDNWGRDNFVKFNALKKTKPNLKTVLAVGGWNEGSAKYSRMAANVTLRKNFISSAIKMVLDHGFDGFNLDWEYPNRRDTVNGVADKQNFLQLIKELRPEFDKYGLQLSAAVAAVEDVASQSYDIRGISEYLDQVCLMSYDMYGPWDPVTGHNAPLHKGEGDSSIPAQQLYTVDVALDYWIQSGCPPEKLLVGLPLYGHTFTLASESVNALRAPSSGAGLAGPYTATNGIIGYNELCDKLQKESWTIRYDGLAKVPYAIQGKNWVSYDDPSSLTLKVAYGIKQNVGGVMVWSIETDDFNGICGTEKFPLLRSINSALSTLSGNSTPTTTTPTVTQTTTTTSSTSTTTTVRSTQGTSTPSPSVCKSEGLAANPEDCTTFYICTSDGRGNFIPHKFKCPSNLYWDNKNLYCNYRDQVECDL